MKNRLGMIFMILHALFMSIDTSLLKLCQKSLNIFQVIFSYNLVIITLVYFFFKDPIILSLKNIKIHFFRSVFGFLGYLLFFFSLRFLPIIDSRIILSTDPIFTSILALYFFKEKINSKKVLGLFFGFLGTVIVLSPNGMSVSLYYILPILASIFFGLFNNFTKKISEGDMVGQLFLLSFFCCIYSFIPSNFLWTIPSINDCLLIVSISISFVLSSFCYFMAYKNAEVSCLMPLHSIGIIFTALIGVIFFKESISTSTFIGATIIIVGSTLPFLKKKQVCSLSKVLK